MDEFKLKRFLDAQAAVYEQVKQELTSGEKRSHWMWFIFPQLDGLGHSETAQFYGISGQEEAQAYTVHPVLGERLTECTSIVLTHRDRRPVDIFGVTDAMKFHSSMTLFAAVAGSQSVFAEALAAFFNSVADGQTLAMLRPLSM